MEFVEWAAYVFFWSFAIGIPVGIVLGKFLIMVRRWH